MRGDYVHYTDFRTSIRMATRRPDATVVKTADAGPDGYSLVYAQDFAGGVGLDVYLCSDAKSWRIGDVAGDACLELHAASQYKPPHRSPRGIAVLATPAVGSFVLEADLMQTGRDYGHRDMCVFFGVRDAAHYYYAHIAAKADDTAHQIHIVDAAARRPITSTRSEGVKWGRDQWHHVRLTRNADSGIIKVYFDDLVRPILTARDVTFGCGLVGFGSFDDTGRIDNVQLWADVTKPEKFDGFGQNAEGAKDPP